MLSRKELKLKTRELMRTSSARWTYVAVLLVMAIIIGALAGIGIGLLLLGGVLSIGLVTTAKNFVNNDKVDFTVPFSALDRFVDALIGYLLVSIYTLLWSLLLVIPGIIAHYRYELTFYLMEEDSSLSGSDAIKKSIKLMKGHKWASFVFDLSFIGWHILSAFTLGILDILFVAPYQSAAKYQFLKQIMDQGQEVVNVEAE